MKPLLTAVLMLVVGFVLFALIAGAGIGPVELWAYAVLSVVVLAAVWVKQVSHR